jgi:hypothetical protein
MKAVGRLYIGRSTGIRQKASKHDRVGAYYTVHSVNSVSHRESRWRIAELGCVGFGHRVFGYSKLKLSGLEK